MAKTQTELEKLVDMIRARYGVVGLRTIEERRVRDQLNRLRDNFPSLKKHISVVRSWSVAEGWMADGVDFGLPTGVKPDKSNGQDRGDDLLEALRIVKKTGSDDRKMFIFYDVDEYLQTAQGERKSRILRQLREVVDALKGTSNMLVLVGASLRFDGALENQVLVLDMPLPTASEIRSMLTDLYGYWRASNPQADVEWNKELEDRLVLACQGMTEQDIEDAVTQATYAVGGYRPDMISIVQQTKKDRIKSVRGLESIDMTKVEVAVGGLDVLDEWVQLRREMFTEEAQDFGVDPAKGIMTVGVPGGGKSLSAKALARALNLPLYRVNVAGLYDKYVGNTEEHVARLQRSLEAAAPCVAWFDEAEKAFASGGSDNPVSQRVLGQFLSWMEDRAGGVVCYFTANQVENLPPELMRMGRLDERFFVGLPGHEGRKEIWRIHLAAKKRDPQKFDLDALAGATRGWTGAEIKTGLQNGLIRAFAMRKQKGGKTDITTDILIGECQKMTPLCISQRDKIERMLRWARENRIVQASSDKMCMEPDGLPTVDFLSDADGRAETSLGRWRRGVDPKGVDARGVDARGVDAMEATPARRM